MKRTLLLSATLSAVFAFAFVAHALGVGEQILQFSSGLHINADASVDVAETIVYDFGPIEKHGIYRDIPVVYDTSFGATSVGLSNMRVTDESGAAYSFTQTRSGPNEEIKIGDANKTISGVHTYIISYHIERAITYFDTRDELYWNVTGNGWQVPILQASATVTLPKAVSRDALQTACYQGVSGATAGCVLDAASDTAQAIHFSSNGILSSGEGLTVAVGFPKGLVSKSTWWQVLLQTLLDNWVLGLPLFVLIGMTGVWWVKGRDPRGSGTIIPEYEAPDNLTPLEVAAVLKEGGALNQAISAEIIYLATRGYLSLQRINEKVLFLTHTDYTLHRLKPNEGLVSFDSALADGLFSNAVFTQGDTATLSGLKNKFYTHISAIQSGVYGSVVAKKFFAKNPSTIRNAYFAAGLTMAVLSGIVVSSLKLGTAAVLAGVISGIIIVVFSFIMPRVTKEGALMRERIKGLKWYLSVAEKDRIAFHDAPEKNPQLFEALLPYAMVLGVEKEWAKQFEGIYTQPPGWYSDSNMQGFNALMFANSLKSFSTSATQTLASAPGRGSGSGGGGFSGGGFGGGGGGSW